MYTLYWMYLPDLIEHKRRFDNYEEMHSFVLSLMTGTRAFFVEKPYYIKVVEHDTDNQRA